VSACAAAKQLPPAGWTSTKESVDKVFSPTTRELKPGALPGAWMPDTSDSLYADLGSKHHIANPIHIYPLYENGFRAFRQQSVVDNHKESAKVRSCEDHGGEFVIADQRICRCMRTLLKWPKATSMLGVTAHPQKPPRALGHRVKRIG
jgi:hypothetical protein